MFTFDTFLHYIMWPIDLEVDHILWSLLRPSSSQYIKLTTRPVVFGNFYKKTFTKTFGSLESSAHPWKLGIWSLSTWFRYIYAAVGPSTPSELGDTTFFRRTFEKTSKIQPKYSFRAMICERFGSFFLNFTCSSQKHFSLLPESMIVEFTHPVI